MLGSDVTQPPSSASVCVCVCAARSFSQLSCLLPSRSSSLALSVGQWSRFRIARASRPGPPCPGAPILTLALATRTHNPSALGHRDSVGSPARYEDFRNHPGQGNKERSFSNHFPEIFSFNFLQTTSLQP